MNLKTIDTWHKTPLGYLVFGLIELGGAYTVASLAIDSGSLWEWAVAFIFLFGFVQNIARMLVRHR